VYSSIAKFQLVQSTLQLCQALARSIVHIFATGAVATDFCSASFGLFWPDEDTTTAISIKKITLFIVSLIIIIKLYLFNRNRTQGIGPVDISI
jgi:hypothetical protein